MVNRRYKRDFILLASCVTGCMLAIIGITMLGSDLLQKIDNSPITGLVIIASTSCLLFFFKYARK